MHSLLEGTGEISLLKHSLRSVVVDMATFDLKSVSLTLQLEFFTTLKAEQWFLAQ